MSAPSSGSRQSRAAWLFLAPFLALTAVFLLWPLAQALPLAFQRTFGPTSSEWVGLENFVFLVGDPIFWKAVGNTALFAAGSLFLQLPVSLGLALLLNRPGMRGRALFRLLFFAPSLVGMVFAGLLFALLFAPRTGLVNSTIHELFPAFDSEFPWLSLHVMPALILAALWLYAGFNMVYFLAALQNVSPELLEAAALDGAGRRARFVHVVWPAIRPTASFVALLSLLGSLQLFELPYVLLQNSAGPDNRGLTVVMYLYQTGFVTGDLGYASAIGWALALAMASLAAGQRWLAARRED